MQLVYFINLKMAWVEKELYLAIELPLILRVIYRNSCAQFFILF